MAGTIVADYINNDDISGGFFGVGQTWQNVTASRSSGVTYTNTTGKPIQVNISHNASSGNFTMTVDGNIVASLTDSTAANVGFTGIVVPNGSNYSTNITSITNWSELR